MQTYPHHKQIEKTLQPTIKIIKTPYLIDISILTIQTKVLLCNNQEKTP